MKLSFCTLGCPDWSLEEIARQGQAMGYDGVELRGAAGNHLGPEETPAERDRIRQLFADHGLAIACVMGYSNFTGDEDARAAALDHMTKMTHTAADIGCKTLRVFGGHNAELPRDERIRRVVESLRELAPIAESRGVQLAMETHDDWCIGENLMAVIKQVNSPAVGVCWDVSNAFFVEPMEQTYQAIAGRISHVHFKDAARNSEGKVKSQLPGTGDVDMRGALALLKAGGYDGWLSFEWEKKWEPDLADPEIAFPHYLKTASALMADVGVSRG